MKIIRLYGKKILDDVLMIRSNSRHYEFFVVLVFKYFNSMFIVFKKTGSKNFLFESLLNPLE